MFSIYTVRILRHVKHSEKDAVSVLQGTKMLRRKMIVKSKELSFVIVVQLKYICFKLFKKNVNSRGSVMWYIIFLLISTTIDISFFNNKEHR